MHVHLDLPPPPSKPDAFGKYWLNTFFIQSPSSRYEINVLVNTYVRLVDAGLIEYQEGCRLLRGFWSSDAALNLVAMHRSVSHFESCIFNINRAINCFRRLRGDKHHDPIAVALRAHRFTFAADAIADRVRGMRNEIHHIEDSVLSGLLSEGESTALRADGIEVPHPTEANQTIRTIDHLVIGAHRIAFRELVQWLAEMADVVVHLVEALPAIPSPAMPSPDASFQEIASN